MSRPLEDAATAPEIELAAHHDAAGRHHEAINLLARAAARGDVEATTRLAKRLIVGDRAPLLPADGAGLLREAAERGGAEAAARLAVLAAAGGVATPPDWERALDLLCTAAERGWQPAVQQLQVLAAERLAAGNAGCRVEPAASQDVRALRAIIGRSERREARRGVTLHESPLVRAFPSFVSREACAWLVTQSHDKLAPARVYDPVERRDVVDSMRTNTAADFNLMEADLVHLMVQARMAAACGCALANLEGPTVLHYAVGQEIKNHYDFVDPSTPNYEDEVRIRGQRVITFLLYLNEGYAGGETDFPRLGFSHKGQLGEGLFFVNADADGRPDARMMHAGRPPTSGEKWVFSQFVRSVRVMQPL